MLRDFVRVCYIPGTIGETFIPLGPLIKMSKPHPHLEKTTGVMMLLQPSHTSPLSLSHHSFPALLTFYLARKIKGGGCFK